MKLVWAFVLFTGLPWDGDSKCRLEVVDTQTECKELAKQNAKHIGIPVNPHECAQQMEMWKVEKIRNYKVCGYTREGQ